jgi:membrane associated rhomboid family serine protease
MTQDSAPEPQLELVPPDEPELEGYLPPDPDEVPPLSLGAATGDVRPWGTLLVLLVWGVIAALFALRALTGDTRALIAWGANLGGAPWPETTWRLLASTFLHAGLLHVIMNALGLLMFGAALEALFARWAFPIAYVVGGMSAAWGSLAWHTLRHGNHAAPSVGGSGVVFAFGGALLAASLRLRGRLAVGRARAMAAGALFLLTQSLVAGFAKLGTDNAAHATGLVAGVLIGMVLPLSSRLGGAPASLATRLAAGLATMAMVAALVIMITHGARRVW